MSERRSLASGDVLAHRYELQDLVTEKHGASTWRAHDQVLNRNVGLELLPSEDERSGKFLEAARLSTAVSDPRFLRVLDLIEDEQEHHLIVREWARAFPLDQVLAQSPLPNRRAATVVAEVAEALAHAHENGVFHRRLTPHQVLLKQSGAVRVVGLGVAMALAPAQSERDLVTYEAEDVHALGRLLYAAVTSRWPGESVDGLVPAPTEHDRLLRPRQVRAGVSRDLDRTCDRILNDPPRHHESPLTTAASIARTLRFSGEDDDIFDDQPSLVGISSPDLLRLDPVIVPTGPPPGLEPPRRRPKAFEPAPPTTMERVVRRGRRATKGDRALVLAGVVVTVVIAAVLVGLGTRGGSDEPTEAIDPSIPLRALPVRAVTDFDPQGVDDEENPEQARLAIDGDPETGWTTTQYFNSSRLGGLKDGVGLVFDLGGDREVASMRILLSGAPTGVQVRVAPPGASSAPKTLKNYTVASTGRAGEDLTVSLPSRTVSRYVLVWLTDLPQVDTDRYRGQINEVTFTGRS